MEEFDKRFSLRAYYAVEKYLKVVSLVAVSFTNDPKITHTLEAYTPDGSAKTMRSIW